MDTSESAFLNARAMPCTASLIANSAWACERKFSAAWFGGVAEPGRKKNSPLTLCEIHGACRPLEPSSVPAAAVAKTRCSSSPGVRSASIRYKV